MRRGAVLMLIGIAGIASLRVAYNLTYEPAPAVRVRWRDGTGDWRRRVLEMKYRLANPSGREGLSFSYVLMDTSGGNIERLVKDPEAADTNDIDRRRFEVPFWTAHYSTRLMWIADRTPGLRWPAVRWSLVAMLLAMTLDGTARVVRAVAQWAARRA